MIDPMSKQAAMLPNEAQGARSGRRDQGADFNEWLADRPVGAEGEANTYVRPNEGRIPLEELLAVRDQLARDISPATGHGISPRASDATDFKLLPWRLCANLGLSYEGKAPPPGAGPFDPCHAIGVPGTRAGAMMQAAVMPPVAYAPASGRGADASPAVAVPDESREVESAARASATRAPDPGRLSHLLWPQRLVRSQSGDDGVTLWVRDYRFNPDDTVRLVAALRCEAQQAGQSLHRIVLNGHELWRDPTHS